MLLQDDALSLSTSLSGAQDSSRRIEILMKGKQLNINVQKSVVLLFANRKKRELIEKEIKEQPLVYDNMNIEVKTNEKWLGEVVNSEGDSISSTIQSRKARIINAIH